MKKVVGLHEFYNVERLGRHLMESKENMGLLDDWYDSAVGYHNVIQSLQTKH